jgi:hypothetical protein
MALNKLPLNYPAERCTLRGPFVILIMGDILTEHVIAVQHNLLENLSSKT